tara:strand:- start:5337 stop:6332 length:996 start_codon:yes stop_codon:yes gene_type:complete
MKFLNKKEQVFDIQLTPYGKQKLSMGKFNPTYYAFFDDNVLYDIRYAHTDGAEVQNDIHKRIKQETAYLEGQAIFNQILSGTTVAGGLFGNVTLTQEDNLYTTDAFIGDALLQSQEQNVAPAWKVITMQGTISSSIPTFTGSLSPTTINRSKMEAGITQVNIDAHYALVAEESQVRVTLENLRNVQDTSPLFADDTVVRLEQKDALIYVEELNTELLVDNFDVEVFEVPTGEDAELRRLYFKNKVPQVVDGMLVHAAPVENTQELDRDSVEYYFSIDKDYQIDPKIACKYLNQFNTEDYLIDLDFDCEDIEGEDLYFDIYGRVTESEICPD